MNITANAASLNWKTNNKGVWKALVKDMAPNSSVTFRDGLTGTVAGKQVTVESQSMPTGFMTYTTDDDTAVYGGVLYGAGTVSDSLEVVSGGKTVRMGSVDLGTLNWSKLNASTSERATCQSNMSTAIKSGSNALVTSNGYIRYTGNWSSAPDKSVFRLNDVLCIRDTSFSSLWSLSDSDFNIAVQSALTGVMLYYELAEPTTSTETVQSLALQTGVNSLALNERDSSFTLNYTGTEFTLQLDSAHKYAFSDNGTKSMLTGSTEQAVTGGQDMLVDVTRMFNGDTTAINAVTSWADMAEVMPDYLSNVAYNEGEVVGRSGGVTTAKWNQLVQNGNFADGDTGWRARRSTIAVANNVCTWMKNSESGRSDLSFSLSSVRYGHRYFVSVDVTSSVDIEALQIGLYSAQGSPLGSAASLSLAAGQRQRGTLILTTTNMNFLDVSAWCIIQNYLPDNLAEGVTQTYQNIMLFDLTEIYGAGHEPSTVEEFEADCAKWGKDLSQYQPYDAGTPMGGSATFTGLHGVGTAKDTQDVVTGEKTVRIGTVDMGTMDWNAYYPVTGDHPYGYTVCSSILPAKLPGKLNMMAAGYTTMYAFSPDKIIFGVTTDGRVSLVDSSLIGKTGAEIKTALSGITLYYELATPTSSTETPQPLTAVKGLNNVHEQNMSITGTPLTMGYTGTDQTISTETSSKYLARIDGVDSVVDNVESIDVRGGRDRVVDLTYMFGEGNEPTTAADFYKLFPTLMGYAIPYNKGSLVNFKGTGLKSVGFNLLDLAGRTPGEPQNTASSSTTVRGPFDETKYYLGFNGGNSYEPSAIRKYEVGSSYVMVNTTTSFRGIGFPIRVIPGREYRCENLPATRRFAFIFYTYNGKFLNSVENLSNTYVSATAPEDAYWCLLLFYNITTNVDTVWTNPCVHLQWSGGRNGDYEPYWDYTRPLPTLTYFQQGMNGRGQVYDEMTSRQAITRLAEVDMEDLEWTESSGSWTATLPGMKSGTTTVIAENGYNVTVSGTSVTIASGTSPVGRLVYELATQATVTFPEEMAVTAQVSDYGTESVVPANGYELVTAPFLGIVKYQDNYARTITKLPENYQSQESMDALQLVLGQLLNVTLTSRFDAEEQAYGYTVTGDGVPGLIAAALTALAPVTGLTFRGGTYMPTDGMVALPDPTIQAITTIPASTSSYTLGEGVYSHAPNSVPTYTLPDVEDATVVHTAKLTVKMSTGVLTANFRNSAGDAISYESPTGAVSSGTLVEYVCTYEPLASGWAVAARVVMQTA